MSHDNWDMFRDIAAITQWIDAANSEISGDDAMRVLKISEEITEAYEMLAAIAAANGRAAAAFIGMTGQNPRKGVTHSLGDLNMELADVAITALCAISHFTGNNPEVVRGYLAAKISQIITRADIKSYAEELEPLWPDPTVNRLAAMHGANWHAAREPTLGEEFRKEPLIPAHIPAGYCARCVRSGVGACDDFPNCPAGR
jgi:NTP pyrophosphatase (non-canonical NTP hydrolase)